MNRVTFPKHVGFYNEVRRRVNTHFEENGISRHADWRMVLKTAAILSWLVGAYVMFVTSPSTWLWTVCSAVAVAQGIVLVGFNIMHDAVHGSYTRNPRLNWFIGLSLDFVGGSSLFWRYKHNILHHTYTNINELDDDLDVPGMLRFSPDQPWKPWHRYQHWYAFPAYTLMTLSWVTRSDFQKFLSRRIGDYRLPRLPLSESVLFITLRLLYFGYMLALPMLFHPVLHVFAFFLLVHAVVGFTLAIVFQVAHVVGDSTFPSPNEITGEVDNEWAVHQVETTSNFAADSTLMSLYCGGLNFQIEHHLFPRICHVHYPAISRIVKRTCEEFGVRYVSYPTLFKAVSAHRRFLRVLGAQPATS